MKLLTIALTTFAFSLPTFAESVHGIFRVVKGDVKVKSASGGDLKPARLGDKVFPKDTIITGKEGRAKIVMTDKNEINVSPESQVVFANYEFKPEENKKEVLLDVIYGKVRSKVNQKYDNTQNNKFQVRTPSAVAGVRGTDFAVAYISAFAPPGAPMPPPMTQVVTFEGNVQFGARSASGAMVNPVFVPPNTTSTSTGGSTSAPVEVPAAQMQAFDANSDASKTPVPGPGSQDNRAPADAQQPAPGDKAPADGPKDSASRNPDAAPSPGFSPVVEADMPGGEGFVKPPLLPPSANGPIPNQPDVPKVNEQIRGAIQTGNTLLKVRVVNGQ